MRAILAGIGAAVIIAAIGAVLLWRLQEPAYQLYSSSRARVHNPGVNLVGENWDGNPQVERRQRSIGDSG